MQRAAQIGLEYLASLDERHVGAVADASAIAERLRQPLPDVGEDPTAVVERLASAVDPGLVASAGPRYFGFVIGGALPAAAAADWLTTAWGQNAAVHALSPAAAAAEQVAGEWMLELLGLPAQASFGLPTGAGLGNAVGLAAARHRVLDRVGWDVEARGLYGAPEITVVIGDEAHATLLTALQYLGLGRDRVTRIPTDEQGRMRADAAIEAVRRHRWPAHRLPPVGQREHGRIRSGRGDHRGHRPASERLGARRRRLRAVGRRRSAPSPPRRRRRPGRFVVDRCSQVVERRLRLRLRGGPRHGSAPRGDVGHRCVPPAQRAARAVGVDLRQLATGARLRAVCRDPAAGAWRRGGARRALLRLGEANGRAAGRGR